MSNKWFFFLWLDKFILESDGDYLQSMKQFHIFVNKRN